jgi:adenine deaminase
MDKAELIGFARGDFPVDLCLKNGRLINVISGEIHDASVAIHKGVVVGIGEYDALDTFDLEGRFLAPGFIDGHIHLESSMLDIGEFARNVVPCGTTSVVTDPHEMANVLGTKGIRYILETSQGLPLRVFVMFPSCVPATPFETSGASLGPAEMTEFRDHERVIGLAEVMNYPGVLFADPEVLSKLKVFDNKVKDGHAPGLSGKDLCAYVAAGIGSDHECTTKEEALEKLRLGMRIMIREGSAAKNLRTLLPMVNNNNSRNCMLVSDDLDPKDIMERGHVNYLVKRAIASGLDPVVAVQMATINTANYFGLKNLGAIVPGRIADIVVLDDLAEVKVSRVYQSGRLVAEAGRIAEFPASRSGLDVFGTVKVNWGKINNFALEAQDSRVKVIEVVPQQIFTRKAVEDAKIKDGLIVADTDRDILKIAVIERHGKSGNVCCGLIRGFGLKRGAMASTVAHDSHNLIVVGVDESDMLVAAQAAAKIGGGMTAVENGNVTAQLPLPIAGLMSNLPINEVRDSLAVLNSEVHKLGCPLDSPFATLSFMALTPIPELKITDQGLFDSTNFKFTPLYGEG